MGRAFWLRMWTFGVFNREEKDLKSSCDSVLIRKLFPLQSYRDSLLIYPGLLFQGPLYPATIHYSQPLLDSTTSRPCNLFRSLIKRLEGFLDYYRVVLIEV